MPLTGRWIPQCGVGHFDQAKPFTGHGRWQCGGVRVVLFAKTQKCLAQCGPIRMAWHLQHPVVVQKRGLMDGGPTLPNPGSRAVPGERPCPGPIGAREWFQTRHGLIQDPCHSHRQKAFPWEVLPMGECCTPCLRKGKDQKSKEKRSLREWSTGDVAVFCSCRSPVRESSHGSPWSCSA